MIVSQFDKSGKYFAKLSEDGKLKVWNVESNILHQEYIPDIHFGSSCTCLQFLDKSFNQKGSKKKKKRNSITDLSPDIALGTSTGKLLIYSILKGNISHVIDGNINQQISCLSDNIEESVYSGIKANIVLWDIQQRKILTQWKSGNDDISAILAVPNTKKLLTASKNIKLWNVESKTVLKTFIGHSSEIHLLEIISHDDKVEPRYVVSGSKVDRSLNCWNIDENTKDKKPTVSLILEDFVTSLSVHVSSDDLTNLSVSVETGLVHIFRLDFNKVNHKAVKPKSKIQVVSPTDEKKNVNIPIPIVCSFFKDESSLLIAYGETHDLTFENVELTKKKLISLLREKVPTTKPPATKEQKLGGKLDISMEERLGSLTLNKMHHGELLKSENVEQLLLQGVRCKDQDILKSVMCRTDEEVIKDTVKNLPPNVIPELVNFIAERRVSDQVGKLWMQHLLKTGPSLNQDLLDSFTNLRNIAKKRLAGRGRLYQCFGRLELLVSQINAASNEESEDYEVATLNFESDSDGGIEMADFSSASENDWLEEQSSNDEDMVENDKTVEFDEDMST